jgi:hypothetical protein
MFLWYARPTWVNDLVTGAHDSGQVLGLCFVSGMARQPSGPKVRSRSRSGSWMDGLDRSHKELGQHDQMP